MPWPTTSGMRTLQGAEADLVRGALGMMVDTHVAELRDDAEAWRYGVAWFDQWDAGQRLWLLRRVTETLLGSRELDRPAAVFDASVDAIFLEIADLVEIEIEQGSLASRETSWRQSVCDAFVSQTAKPPPLDPQSTCIEPWRTLVSRLADAILGVRCYQRAEAFRDADYEQTVAFLRDRGLPQDYLSVMPPLQSLDDTQRSIDVIQHWVFGRE